MQRPCWLNRALYNPSSPILQFFSCVEERARPVVATVWKPTSSYNLKCWRWSQSPKHKRKMGLQGLSTALWTQQPNRAVDNPSSPILQPLRPQAWIRPFQGDEKCNSNSFFCGYADVQMSGFWCGHLHISIPTENPPVCKEQQKSLDAKSYTSEETFGCIPHLCLQWCGRQMLQPQVLSQETETESGCRNYPAPGCEFSENR